MMQRMQSRERSYAFIRHNLVRVGRIAGWLAGIALALFLLDLLGVPVASWIHDLFKQLRTVPPAAIAGAIVLESLQTTFAAIAWLAILRAAFPEAGLRLRTVLASYAVAVALNGFLPANIGTLVMMVMFLTLIPAATFPAVLSGFVVQKIPFTVFSAAVYAYLFATVSGSFSLKLGGLSEHPVLFAVIILGGIALLAIVARVLWARADKLREQIKNGGAILGQPRRFMVGVALPSLVSFAARLGIVAVFLAAFSIPVSFHTVIAVTGANSVSSSLSVTPGGVGVTQALNVLVLGSVTSSANATAYSVAQQLVVSAWDVVFALVLVAWVFGWSGGKELVKGSYVAAEVKQRELREQREARRAARGPRLRAIRVLRRRTPR
jgi:phosphatidylinositol alpha-mannosyltransferase